MNEINIIYISNSIDIDLSCFLDEFYKEESNKKYKPKNIIINYNEYEFRMNQDNDYKEFLKNNMILDNDIILIDSLLFDNTSNTKYYTGEQLKLIINKIYPYKKVLIISQCNSGNNYASQIKKFNKGRIQKENEAIDYYIENLTPYLDYAIEEILDQRKVIDNMIESKNFDKNLVEKLENAINNIQEPYKDFSKKDLNKLSDLFVQIAEELKIN